MTEIMRVSISFCPTWTKLEYRCWAASQWLGTTGLKNNWAVLCVVMALSGYSYISIGIEKLKVVNGNGNHNSIWFKIAFPGST